MPELFQNKINKKKLKLSSATIFIAFMGIVSLLSDMTHEGAAGISGAYLTALGASGAAIGIVSGLGTLIGYGLRILTGYIADKKKNYWAMTIFGYCLDLFMIPLLAAVPDNGWLLACGFLLAGKVGNAVKKPAKDTMVSFAASEKGEGKSFAALEFVDQIGAFLGPTFLFVIMLFADGEPLLTQYRICLAFLALPAIACVAVLVLSKKKFPHPDLYEKDKPQASNAVRVKKTYILYLVGACTFAAGFIDFPLITAFESEKGLLTAKFLPLLYSGAMLTDAFSALLFGTLFDRYGFAALVVSSILSAPFAVLIFLTDGLFPLIAGAATWGIGMGAQESIMKAAVATLTDKANRSRGYGIFQLFFGGAWFVGSAATGFLYDGNIVLMCVFSVSLQVVAAVIFLALFYSAKKTKIKTA